MEEFLGVIWFILWGLLWGIYFMLDGYDFGIGMLLPVLGLSSEREKQAMYDATGPFWDGNEVWLITAGGVTFAAFPLAYAVLFSSLYTPLLLLLLMLIMRGVAAEFRSQWDNEHWRMFWDLTMAGTGVVAALLLGVAFSNLFRGLPLADGHVFQGNILNLLHPYALLGGVLFILLFAVHGAFYLAYRVADGDLKDKAMWTGKALWPVFMLCFLLYVLITFTWAGLYRNYLEWPALFLLPLACLAAFLASGYQLYRYDNPGKAVCLSGVGILLLTMTGVMGMFPNLLPSRLDPSGAVGIAQAASTPKTLGIMLVVALIFVPTVILYQRWAHKLLAVKLKSDY